MDVPLQIAFHNIDKTEDIKKKITENVGRLEKFFNHIISCRVAVDMPHKHKLKGNLFSIKIFILVPNYEIVISRSNQSEKIHKFPETMIKDAFRAARRQLEDYARKVRGDVKAHKSLPSGIVNEVYKNKGYAIIKSEDGRDIYFNKNSLINFNFNKIEKGYRVCFVDEMGDEGPQASTVRLIGRHQVSG